MIGFDQKVRQGFELDWKFLDSDAQEEPLGTSERVVNSDGVRCSLTILVALGGKKARSKFPPGASEEEISSNQNAGYPMEVSGGHRSSAFVRFSKNSAWNVLLTCVRLRQ